MLKSTIASNLVLMQIAFISGSNASCMIQPDSSGHLVLNNIGRSVPPYAFVGCPIVTLRIESPINTISQGAFANCYNLTSVYLDDEMLIMHGAFENCTSLVNFARSDEIRLRTQVFRNTPCPQMLADVDEDENEAAICNCSICRQPVTAWPTQATPTSSSTGSTTSTMPTISSPTIAPVSAAPTSRPSSLPSNFPTSNPSDFPTSRPTNSPSKEPTKQPTSWPTLYPTQKPTLSPSKHPSTYPTLYPTRAPFPFEVQSQSSESNSDSSMIAYAMTSLGILCLFLGIVVFGVKQLRRKQEVRVLSEIRKARAETLVIQGKRPPKPQNVVKKPEVEKHLTPVALVSNIMYKPFEDNKSSEQVYQTPKDDECNPAEVKLSYGNAVWTLDSITSQTSTSGTKEGESDPDVIMRQTSVVDYADDRELARASQVIEPADSDPKRKYQNVDSSFLELQAEIDYCIPKDGEDGDYNTVESEPQKMGPIYTVGRPLPGSPGYTCLAPQHSTYAVPQSEADDTTTIVVSNVKYCQYIASDGLACQNSQVVGSIQCANHTCGIESCVESKSSLAQHCTKHEVSETEDVMTNNNEASKYVNFEPLLGIN